MIPDKRLTCRKVFDSYRWNELTVAARIDGYNNDHFMFMEPNKTPLGTTIINEGYLVGPIADRLYAYEQLGFTPKELREIIQKQRKSEEEHHYLFVTTGGRGNGKTELQRQLYDYIVNDINTARFGADMWRKDHRTFVLKVPEIKNVIFNDPATIVFWSDGTKTVVKATNEDFDPEKGLAMAITKKTLGNEGNYFNKIKKWTEKYVAAKVEVKPISAVGAACVKAANGLKKLSETLSMSAYTIDTSKGEKK